MFPVAPAPAAVSDGRSYWSQARRPWPTLLFLLPLIVTYELGVLWFGSNPAALRNGADCWLRSWLLNVGLGPDWLPPAVLVGGLLAWQVVSREEWRCTLDTLAGMCGESLLFALLLVVAGQSLSLVFRGWGLAALAAGGGLGAVSAWERAVSFLGAGLYEELVFRLALLPGCFFLLRGLRAPRGTALVLAVTLSSLAFAAAHDLTPSDPVSLSGFGAALHRVVEDPARWYGFTFRLLAGAAFAVLLWLRGFGITVGCHAAYDLLAGVVMQPPDGGCM
jgi:hypothetical protein